MGKILPAIIALGAFPATAFAQSEDDYFVTTQGLRVRQSDVYEAWFGSDRYQPNYLRAGVENGAMLLLELGIYWYEPNTSVVDWQFPNFAAKVTSHNALRFDDNLLRTNYMLHSTAGGVHYLMTRTNGFGIAPSFATAVASSVLYETVLEWLEVISINDLIVTPFGGMAAGETMHLIGDYVNSEQPAVRTEVRGTAGSVTRDFAGLTLGLPRNVHDEMDTPPSPYAVERDALGLSTAYAHEFHLRLGQEALFDGDRRGEMIVGRGELWIAAMPGFLRPGRFHRWFSNGNFASVKLRIGGGNGGEAGDVRFHSHLAGYYAQNIGSGLGTATEVALASGLRYVDRRELDLRQHYGMVHLPHPVATLWLRQGGVVAEIGARISPDFASITSASYQRYAEENGVLGTRATLKRHGYAHSFGISGEAFASLRFGDVVIGASAEHGRYTTIDHFDRLQEEIRRPTHGTEAMTELSARLELEPQGSPVSARFEASELRNDSHLDSHYGPYQSSTRVRRLSAELGLSF